MRRTRQCAPVMLCVSTQKSRSWGSENVYFQGSLSKSGSGAAGRSEKGSYPSSSSFSARRKGSSTESRASMGPHPSASLCSRSTATVGVSAGVTRLPDDACRLARRPSRPAVLPRLDSSPPVAARPTCDSTRMGSGDPLACSLRIDVGKGNKAAEAAIILGEVEAAIERLWGSRRSGSSRATLAGDENGPVVIIHFSVGADE